MKKNGRYNWIVPNNSCYFDKTNNELKFRIKILNIIKWKCRCQGRLIQVRFVPRGCVYVMEIVSEISVPNIKENNNRIMGIDLGVNNLIAASNNIGKPPFIINGRGLKSINQFYNKRIAKIQLELKRRHGKDWSNQLDKLALKRFNRIKNCLHNASAYVIKWCVENNIDTLVVGHNKGWKQESGMGKKTNQNFVDIPYNMLIQQLAYKCENYGIRFIETEENYTSGTSFLDGELPCKENYNKSRRIKRGLFQSGQGLINSDINGSLQIIRKVFPNAFSYGIKAYLTPTIINVV